ncbi:MAG: A/G-specific adenine glycosylase [Treponema sp.]|jgi:A/G-specific adenine glycosylase|nr:A/G-specific adenine glycosylase [Treponema sp.]
MSINIDDFREKIYDYYHAAGRDFPWRHKVSPWGVLVSECMLQQTQTDRVRGYYERFMARWPSPRSLHEASLEEVLREWSGLGYNRRALFLKRCAETIALQKGGEVPRTASELAALPGIGPYSAGAIVCFAYNEPAVFIETNIRAVMIHFFFNNSNFVKDDEILPCLARCLDRASPRIWYYALMDYGAMLKKLRVNPNRQSAHYKTQSPFKGSRRELRGRIINTLLERPRSAETLMQSLGCTEKRGDFYRVMEGLQKDLLVAEKEGVYRIR